MDQATRAALQANLDGAIKIYLQARGKLNPADLTTSEFSEVVVPKKGKASRQVIMQKRQEAAKMESVRGACTLPDGCVSPEAKGNFLHGKYIPGVDNVFSAYFDVPGHVFAGQFDADFRMYLLSRPKLAVPKEARALLMPEGDDMWAGGDGSNRMQFYPKEASSSGQPFFEADIDLLASETGELTEAEKEQASAAAEAEQATEKVAEEKKEEEEEEQEQEEMLDYTVWTLLIFSLLMIPITIFFVSKRIFSSGSSASPSMPSFMFVSSAAPAPTAQPVHNISALRAKIRSSLMAS